MGPEFIVWKVGIEWFFFLQLYLCENRRIDPQCYIGALLGVVVIPSGVCPRLITVAPHCSGWPKSKESVRDSELSGTTS